MGQYYKPVNCDNLEWLLSHSYKEFYTRSDNTRIKIGTGLKLMEHSYLGNKFCLAVESLLIPTGLWYRNRIVWAGDYAEEDWYDRATDDKEIHPKSLSIKTAAQYQYIINHTKKEFVDKKKVLTVNGWAIHPLPLLTSMGNGQGGGDFYGEDPGCLVGSWAKDSISIEKEISSNYTEIIFDLTEME
jgi:hypothetical protein